MRGEGRGGGKVEEKEEASRREASSEINIDAGN